MGRESGDGETETGSGLQVFRYALTSRTASEEHTELEEYEVSRAIYRSAP